MLEEITAAVAVIEEKIIAYRRDIHRNPELSGEEERTAAFVAAILEEGGIECTTGVGGHGVTALIRGGGGGARTIALRADLDALPIHESSEGRFPSEVPGVMHACGHDVHTAILLGVALVLSSLKDSLDGDVKLIFQPSEEARESGARAMMGAGVLKDPAPDAILALHCYPELEAGTIAHSPGVMTASADSFVIAVKGKGGHASRPHQTVDAVLVSSLVVNALHHIVSRRTDPLHNAVISIGTIEGGTAENIIADRVEMRGTVRTLDTELRERMPRLIEDTVRGITSGLEADYDFSYSFELPSVVNDPALDLLLRDSARDIVGPDRVIRMGEPNMGAEDFACYLEDTPGVLFRLGTANKRKGITAMLHSSEFDVDEDVLAIGARVMAWTAIRFLKGG